MGHSHRRRSNDNARSRGARRDHRPSSRRARRVDHRRMFELQQLIEELRGDLNMPTAIDQLREGVFAQQRAIIDEMERKSGLVLKAYDALMHVIRTEDGVNDKVRAA